MIPAAVALALPLLPLPAPGGEVYELTPRPASWDEVVPALFDTRWCLPAQRTRPGADLAGYMEVLAGWGEFGDLAAAAAGVPAGERAGWLDGALAGELAVHADAVRALLLDRELLGDGWDPEKDGAEDGFLGGPAWELAAEGLPPWTELPVAPVAEQGAMLVRCDLATWKEVENDLSRYGEDVGAEYEEVRPVDGTLVRGVDPAGRPFASHALFFRRDLPFPFGGYSFELRLLSRLDARGRLVADVYSTSPDFYWMAGRDACLPVRTSGGEPVGLLVVREYGFDLRGVPDTARDRVGSIRTALGNLKRRAEATFTGRGGAFGPLDGVLPDYPVRGRGERPGR